MHLQAGGRDVNENCSFRERQYIYGKLNSKVNRNEALLIAGIATATFMALTRHEAKKLRKAQDLALKTLTLNLKSSMQKASNDFRQDMRSSFQELSTKIERLERCI